MTSAIMKEKKDSNFPLKSSVFRVLEIKWEEGGGLLKVYIWVSTSCDMFDKGRYIINLIL